MTNMLLSGEFKDVIYSKRMLACIGFATYFAIMQRIFINWDLVRVFGEIFQYIFYLYGKEFLYVTFIVGIHISTWYLSKKKRTEDVMYMLYILHVFELYIIKIIIDIAVKELKEETMVEKVSREIVEKDIDLVDTHKKVVEISEKLKVHDDRKDKMIVKIIKKITDIQNINYDDMDRQEAENFFDNLHL